MVKQGCQISLTMETNFLQNVKNVQLACLDRSKTISQLIANVESHTTYVGKFNPNIGDKLCSKNGYSSKNTDEIDVQCHEMRNRSKGSTKVVDEIPISEKKSTTNGQ